MDAEQQKRVQRAAWAFGELLNVLGTATNPWREDPEAIAAYSKIIDDAQQSADEDSSAG